MPENLSDNDLDSVHEGRGGAWVVGQALLFGLFLGSLIWGEPVDDVPGIVVIQIVGLALAVIGAAMSGWAAVHHGTRLTPFPKPTEGMPLIDSGPYRIVRHPMYTGIIAFVLGVGLAYANLATVLTGIAFIVFFMAKTGEEEDMLIRNVPGYREYRSSVHWRLIPYVM